MTLEQIADELAARRNDGRTPGVVRRAFLSRGLTLRAYLALEEADSPLLSGRWPTEDAGAMAAAFCTAWEMVFPGECIPDARALPEGLERLRGAVTRAFATVMPMRWPGQRNEEMPSVPDGLGWVARVVGRLVGLGWRLEEALDLPLDALFVLVAGLAANEGAECGGQDYRERSLQCSVFSGQSFEGESKGDGNHGGNIL